MAKSNQQLHTEALESVILTVVRLLHERGILPAQSVSEALQSQHYQAVAALDHEANPYLQVYQDVLLQIANETKPT